jgi:hypothetical protein
MCLRMYTNMARGRRRILLIHDNPSIHRDFSRPLPPNECRELFLEPAQRSSFTDTLRLRITRAAGTELSPADVGNRKAAAGRSK